jgi:hypothetical protein
MLSFAGDPEQGRRWQVLSAGYVFTATAGGPVRHHNFMARHVKPAAIRAGLPPRSGSTNSAHTCAALRLMAASAVAMVTGLSRTGGPARVIAVAA